MSKLAVIEELEKEQLKNEIPVFHVGDTIRVHFRLVEGNKERIQVFTGTVIARKGSNLSETISLYRVAYGEAMERVFLLHSPKVAKIEVVKEGKVRRSKLYYLRGAKGKAARVKGRVVSRARAGSLNHNVQSDQEVDVSLDDSASFNEMEEVKTVEVNQE